MSDLVLREDRKGLAILTLNRLDKLNALTIGMFEQLREYLMRIAAETDHVGLVLLRGAGRCFSSGNDLADIARGQRPSRLGFQADTIELLAGMPQPVIVAVHGYCYTGALDLALAGDIIVCAESSRFADTHAKWALTPGWGMSQRLPRRIGTAKAQEMTFTARTYTGPEAQAMGLVNWCVPDASFEAELETFTQGILANSWHTLRAYKRLHRETEGLPLPAALSYEIHRSEGRGPDAAERIARFLNRS